MSNRTPRVLTDFHTLVFAALRVFAICNRSYVWPLPVFALNMVPFVTNMVRVASIGALSNFIGDRPLCTGVLYDVEVRVHRRALYRPNMHRGGALLCANIQHVSACISLLQPRNTKNLPHRRKSRRKSLSI